MEDSKLRDMLEKYSTDCFSIEYRGFLSNHVSHGIIALARLGASKERVEQFVTWYRQRLETPEQNPKETTLPENHAGKELGVNYNSLLGKRMAFYPLLDHYRENFRNECQESMEAFITKHLPVMVEGICCSALHPLIHTGYGYNARCPQIVLEGIAYLHHSHLKFPVPEKTDFGKGSMDALDVLEEIRKDEKLCGFNFSDEEQIKWLSPDWTTSDFQKRMAILAHSRSVQVASYADRIQLPGWFKSENASFSDVMRLCDWVIDNAVAVYTASENRNDFFLLHGVTAAWALKQALSAMKGTEVQVLLKCIQEFVYVLCATYIVQNSPKMIRSYLTEAVEESWEQVIKQAVDSEKDEHVYKLVQVCHERALMYPTNQQDIFKRASLSSLEFEFVF